MKATFRFVIFIGILLVGIASLAFYWTFYKSLPNYTATLHLPGIEAGVDIHWDTFGIPHIYADSEEDLYYALGYVHAQDRLWQMTLSQIAAEGRFAEFFGEERIEFDKHQRTLGFWNTARSIDRQAPPELQQILQKYAEGINDYVHINRDKLPIEFSLLDMKPIPWTTVHSHAMSRLMAWEMNTSWWSELTLAWLEGELPSSILQELVPDYRDSYPTMMNDSLSRQLTESALPVIETEFALRSYTQRNGTSAASNAWAIDGSRTESGLPLLAGDPHMSLSMPGSWYEAHLSLHGRNLSGATMPGAPVFVLGQNDDIAWTLTSMNPDDTDFFIERAHPDGERYMADSLDGEAFYEPFQWRDEVLKIKDSDDRLYRIKSTHHGPVISSIHPAEELMGDYMISMSWTGHEVSQELWSLYQVNWAENPDDFLQAIEQFHSPGQNFTYADRHGNIAIYSAARLPVRDHNPILFRHGWDPSHDWQGWIPFEELPRVVNPASGYVANANNKLHTDDYPHYISTFWEPPSRIERIEEYFVEHDIFNVDIMRQMQNDSYSVHAREVVELILPVLRRSGHQFDFSIVAPYLENWDFRYEPGSTAATILDAFFLKLTENTLRDELGDTAYRNFIRKESVPVLVINRLLQENSLLLNEPGTGTMQFRDDLIIQSMQDAVDWLTEHYGDEPFQWRWENLHTITFRPPLLAEAAMEEDAPGALKLIVNNLLSKGPYAASGHGMSLNKGAYEWSNPFEMVHGPAIRRIVDLSAPQRSYSVLPTGQSGNPLSDFFGDQTDLWLNGQYRYMYQDSTLFREISYQSMRLLPAGL